MSTQEQIRAIAPENKVAVGSSLQTAAQIMAGYADAGDKGVVGGYSGTFPLTAASEGGIYLVPATGKFYVCEAAYNGAQISAPNSNFVELSVWKNHDRLNNLITFIDKEFYCDGSVYKIPYPNSFNSHNSYVIPVNIGETKIDFYLIKLLLDSGELIVKHIENYQNNIKIRFFFIKK